MRMLGHILPKLKDIAFGIVAIARADAPELPLALDRTDLTSQRGRGRPGLRDACDWEEQFDWRFFPNFRRLRDAD